VSVGTKKYYYLEPESCPGFVISAGERDVTLEAVGNDPESEQWTFVSVFEPQRMLYGMMLVNARTERALFFVNPNKPVTVGSSVGPISHNAVWSMDPVDETFWKLSAVADEGQSLDQGGACAAGGIIQAWGNNKTSHQRWRLNEAT
jgi:hypothetical protein